MEPLTALVVAIATGAAVVALSAPAVAGHRPATDERAIQAQLDQMTGADRIPGAEARVRDRNGRSVTLTSGTAQVGTGRPMVGGDGRFRIASVTKSFTRGRRAAVGCPAPSSARRAGRDRCVNSCSTPAGCPTTSRS
jgi:hypothetical protein